MFRLTVEDKFSSAHQLRGYKGKCENIHGHNWKVQVSVKSKTLNDIDLAMDFHDIKHLLAEVIKTLDHKLLNDVPPFDKINPSSENLAKFIYDELSKKLAGSTVSMDEVTVWESDTCKATYYEG